MSYTVYMEYKNNNFPTKDDKNTKDRKNAKQGQLNLDNYTSIEATFKNESGARKAAKLLLALGIEEASSTLKQLDADEIELIMREMTQVEQINASEREALLTDFQELLKEQKDSLRGGLKEARKFMEASLGSAASEAILQKIHHQDLYDDFSFLEGIEAQALASILGRESPQVVSVALSYMKPKVSAKIMQYLDTNFRNEVALRIAKAARIQPEAIQRVARILREKFERRAEESYSDVGGVQSLAHILNHMDREKETEILESLEEQKPDIISKVKELLYSFDELLYLSLQEMRLLISHLKDDPLLATALRGLHQDLRLHFYNAMSQNRASDIIDEIDRRGPIHIKEVHEARSQILSIARQLDEDGLLHIKKAEEKDKYI